MKKLELKAIDFYQAVNHDKSETQFQNPSGQYVSVANAVSVAQAKHDAFMKELMNGAKVVYGVCEDENIPRLASLEWTFLQSPNDTHTALLIDVKELEKKPCEHKNIIASIPLRGFDLSKATHFHQKPEQFYCLDCAVEIEPTGWAAK